MSSRYKYHDSRNEAINELIELLRSDQDIIGLAPLLSRARIVSPNKLYIHPSNHCLICDSELPTGRISYCKHHWDCVELEIPEKHLDADMRATIAAELERELLLLHTELFALLPPHIGSGTTCAVCNDPATHLEKLLNGGNETIKFQAVCADHALQSDVA